MFTGIIQAVGSIQSLQEKGGDVALSVATGKLPMSNVKLGDSIAINGVCLTVVQMTDKRFVADVSRETLSLTSLGNLKTGSHVNLERALTLQDHLGGHLVSGHVDGLGQVKARRNDGRSEWFEIAAPKALAKYIAAKGSITIDGVSLTVNRVDGHHFEINVIPQTLQETVIGGYQAGTAVNLEVDLLARYLERLLLGDKAAIGSAQESGITEGFLKENGY
jgi:riboflavin synthase